jgi:protein-S-isoprenylcysteine O-methyltransferase Ste14
MINITSRTGHIQVRQVRRFLFLTFMVQEGVIFLRATPQERAQAPIPPYAPIFGLLLLAPLVRNSVLPRWLERFALGLQVLGWALEVAAMIQLARQQSFGIHPTAATQAQQRGLYRFEHPIYLGLLISMLGWTLPVPSSTLAVLFAYIGFRHAIRQERAHLASLQVRHRGIDSFIWSNWK